MEHLAAIDVGSNTLRMVVARKDRRGIRVLARFRAITGLGKQLRTTGEIGPGEFSRSLAVLKDFSRTMARMGVASFRACGTAALREARNASSFLAASEAAGVPVEVIPAEEEAALTLRGVGRGAVPAGRGVVMDIGGGSTEFIDGGRRLRSVSLPIGVAALCGLFPLSDPPRGWEIRNLRYFLEERIRTGTQPLGVRSAGVLVGTAGTFTTLAALDLRMKTYRPERIDGHVMRLDRVKGWERRILSSTEKARLALPGMEKGREKFIVPGIVQAVAAMEKFGAGRLVVSDAGILEGILEGLCRRKGGTG